MAELLTVWTYRTERASEDGALACMAWLQITPGFLGGRIEVPSIKTERWTITAYLEQSAVAPALSVLTVTLDQIIEACAFGPR